MNIYKSLQPNPKTGLQQQAVFESISITTDERNTRLYYREIEIGLDGEPYKPDTARVNEISILSPEFGLGSSILSPEKRKKNTEVLTKLRSDILLLVEEAYQNFDFE